jgi:hypothetical protein
MHPTVLFIISYPGNNAKEPQMLLKTVPPTIASGHTMTALTADYVLALEDSNTPIHTVLIPATGPVYANISLVKGAFAVLMREEANWIGLGCVPCLQGENEQRDYCPWTCNGRDHQLECAHSAWAVKCREREKFLLYFCFDHER